jgi:hypothetical protein
MIAFIFVTFSIAYLGMGTENAFKPEVYDASGLWIAVSFVLGFVAAILGGFVCSRIAPQTRAPIGLAVVVLVVGLLMNIPVFMAEPTSASRGSDVGVMEAMQNARQAAWVALLNPFLGAVGTLIGGRSRKTRQAD